MSDASAKRDVAPTKGARSEGALISVEWFPKPAPPAHGSVMGTLIRIGVGLLAGGVFYALKRPTMAYVVWGIALAVGAVSLASPKARDAILRGLAAFGAAVGKVVGNVFLTLAYFFVLTPAHYIRRLTGVDELRLRRVHGPTYYEPCDAPERKVRYAHAMFATEVVKPRRGGILVPLITLVILLAVAEGILRSQGFGPGAVLYRADPYVGYYPSPGQKLDRYGGRVFTNNFGMRAPDFAEDKPAGTFRILMLGDSTLWGGSYVDQDELYARILDKKLAERASGQKVEVLNMGVNGWGPFHERGFVERFGTFGSDIVMICMPHDDVDREKYGLMTLPYFVEGHAPSLALEEVAAHSMWRYRRGRVAFSPEWRAEQTELGIREYDRLGAFLKDGLAASGQTAEATVEGKSKASTVGGAEVIFEILPSKQAGVDSQPSDVERGVVDRLTQKLSARGVAVHFPMGVFANKGKPEDLYHDDVHLHVRGHKVYADYLFETITTKSERFQKWLSGQGAKKQ